ncbi:hypothetical protein C8R43DRAFT_1125767 [Mycena crocata]|nr:hypothetical protein C8R43DRAFT_1125767 [Mycena crocata]
MPDDFPILTTTPVPSFTFTRTPDQLTSHHQHLESLLDSVPATIIQALNYYTLAPSTNPKAAAHPATTDSPHHAPTPAMYAAIAHSPSPTTSDPHPTKQWFRSLPAPSASRTALQSVTIWFDLNTTHVPARPPSYELYLAIADALADPTLLGGVRWSQRGNLILQGSQEYPRPIFETDARWHTVVLHGIPASTASAPDFLDTEGARIWLEDCTGTTKAISVLCCQEDLKTKSTVAQSKLSTTPYNVHRAHGEFLFINIAFKPHGRADATEHEGRFFETIVAASQHITSSAVWPDALRIKLPATQPRATALADVTNISSTIDNPSVQDMDVDDAEEETNG